MSSNARCVQLAAYWRKVVAAVKPGVWVGISPEPVLCPCCGHNHDHPAHKFEPQPRPTNCVCVKV